MKMQFDAEDSQGHVHPVSVEKVPDECPLCHIGIDPLFRFAFFLDNEYPTVRNNDVQTVLQCPRGECLHLFIAYYHQWNEAPRHLRGNKYVLQATAPFLYKKTTFPEHIEKVTPSFCEIFNEAAHAELWNLSNIAGPGYRKALEFLIKDFLIASCDNDEDKEKIKKTWLGYLIKAKIEDHNIKSCAERAAWLGNDESHYLRKWNDKDLSDLKTLIKLCVNWIENVLLTKSYQESMKNPRKN